MRTHAHTRDNVRAGFRHRRENGKTLGAQTTYPIRMKLRTVTHRSRPGGLAEPLFQISSARGHFVGDDFSLFALWRKIEPFDFPETWRK